METKILPVQTLRGWLSEDQAVSGEFSSPQVYSGPYDVSSSTEGAIILDTGGRVLSRDIVIEPVEIGPNDTATSDDILEGLTAHARGELLVGTIPVREREKEIITKPGETRFPSGYYANDILVEVSDKQLKTENIRDGAEILGIRGGFTGDATATENDILEGKKGYAQGQEVIGVIPVIEKRAEVPLTTTTPIVSTPGYYKQGVRSYIDRDNIPNLTEDNIRDGVSILGVIGTMQQYTDTTDATAGENSILEGYTAYAQGAKLTGTIPIIEDNLLELSDISTVYGETGYYPDGPSARIDVQNVTNLLPENIMAGVDILGVRGIATGGIDLDLATATENDILEGKTAYIADGLLEGTLPLQSETTKEVLIDTPEGESLLGGVYRNGLSITIDGAEQIVPENLVEGTTILGVSGVMKGVAKPYVSTLLFTDALTDENGNVIIDETEIGLDGAVLYQKQ